MRKKISDELSSPKNRGEGGLDFNWQVRLFMREQVYDEAHAMKNTLSDGYQRLSKLRPMRRVLLSGTPVQNNLTELFSLMCFCLPDLFVADR